MWQKVLENDPDRNFLWEGINNGFRIVPSDSKVICDVEIDNYISEREINLKTKIEEQLKQELNEGKYHIAKQKPRIISPIFAIPKSNGSVRIIQDCSKPMGNSLNTCAKTDYKIKYQTVEDAIKFMHPDCFMCKIDLKSAFRSVPIHPDDYMLTGIKYQFAEHHKPTYMYNTRLPQGASFSPMIFHRLSQAIKRYTISQGIKTVAYLDDFILIADDYQSAKYAQNWMIRLLRRLGFDIAWEKLVGPAQIITFLGVELNSLDMSIRLPPEKVVKFKSMLKDFKQRKRISRKQLEKLCGKLSWAASVVKAGRCYLRQIFDLLGPLRKTNHKTRCNTGFYDDISWWIQTMDIFPGKRILLNKPVQTVIIDACDEGSGFMFKGDWGYVNWQRDFPHLYPAHINTKETISAIFAVWRWCNHFKDSKVLFITDSTTARSNIFKGTSRNPEIMPWLRHLHMLSVIYNFDILSCHIPGHCMPADDISRLHNFGHLRNFMSTIGHHDNNSCAYFMFSLPCHTSVKTALFIYQQVICALDGKNCYISNIWSTKNFPERSQLYKWQN